MSGGHAWEANGAHYTMVVDDVRVAGQPVGALMEFLLDEAGDMKLEKKAIYPKEIGIINVGMSTVDLTVVRGGVAVERFTTGFEGGARRLLTMLNPGKHYTLHEMDARARNQQLTLNGEADVWWSEINGKVILCGGGTYLLKEKLQSKFGPLVYSAANPVLSTCVGLERIGLFNARKKEKAHAGEAQA
jgi:hypothetical protein